MKKWLKVALYVVGGFVALHALAILVIPVIGGWRMAIEEHTRFCRHFPQKSSKKVRACGRVRRGAPGAGHPGRAFLLRASGLCRKLPKTGKLKCASY